MLRAFADARHRDNSLPAPVDERLRRIARAFLATLSFEAVEGARLHSPDALLTYLRYDMASLSREHFRVLFLDGGNRLLGDRTLWVGTVDCVQSHPREVVRIALELGSTAIILVHNHPTGSAAPSDDDRRATRRIVQACAPLDIIVHDHIVIGRSDAFSMRASGLLAELEQAAEAGERRRPAELLHSS